MALVLVHQNVPFELFRSIITFPIHYFKRIDPVLILVSLLNMIFCEKCSCI